MNTFLIVGLLLALKHFLCDGPWQTPYQYLNKGKFLHPGGLYHASLHGLCTFCIFALLGLGWFGVLDFIMHYTIDLLKTRLTAMHGWSRMVTPNFSGDCPHQAGLLITSDKYFWALVADQSLHFATYVVFLSVLAR